MEVIVTTGEKGFALNAGLEELLKCANQVGEPDTELLTKRRAFMPNTYYCVKNILFFKNELKLH